MNNGPGPEPSRPPSDAETLLTPGRFALFLGILMVISFPEALLGSQTFVFRDFGYFGYPIAHYHRESFWNGEIPLWNPLNHCGVPFLAQWNTLTLYPLSLIYLLLPLSWSLGFFTLLHIYLAGLGMYFLASRWTGNRLAGAVAGVAFAFNGLSLNCLLWPNNAAALAWMPWMVMSAQTGWREGGRKLLPAAGLASLQFLTGAPEIIVLTWVFLGGLLLADLFQTPSQRAVRVARLAAVGLLVLALCAVQFLPFLDLAAHSQRDKNYGGDSWAMPGWGWANFLVPLFYTFPLAHDVRFQYGQLWISSYYLGIGVLAWSLLALICVPSRVVRLLGLMSLICAVMALGADGHLHTWVKTAFPLVGFIRFPVKFVILVVFGMPILAAWFVGFATKEAKSPPLKATVGVGLGLLALMGLIVWFAAKYPQYQPPHDNWPLTWQSALSRAVFLLLLLAMPFVLATARIKPVVAQLAALSLLWLDIMTSSPKPTPTAARSVFTPDLDYIKPKPAHGAGRAMMSYQAFIKLYNEVSSDTFTNYLQNRLALNTDLNLLDGVSKIDGFFSLTLKESESVRYLLYHRPKSSYEPLLDFLNVSHATATNSLFDWQLRTNFLPFVTGGQKPVFLDDPEALAAISATNFSGRSVVCLPKEAAGVVKATNAATVRIENPQVSAHRIAFKARADGPALAVVSQSFYHPWKCLVNGRATRIWRANYGYQAVEVGPGDSLVELVYDDRLFKAGAAVSALSLAGMGIAWRRGNRRGSPGQPPA